MSSFYPRPFGRYWLLKALAEGGMGALHLAATGDPGLEKLCVIKTVLPQKSDAEYLARFTSEAQVVVRLSHGNLVPVLDVGHVDEQLYLAMDYVEGKDLREVWNQCSREGVGFPVDVAVYIIREVLRGLAYAHHAPGIRLVHRDVSPHNILLSFTGEVKLADFGLAKSTLSTVHTEAGVVYGKLSYMSPEQARGDELDGRSDIYAAGIVLWELLTGRRLFPGETVESRRESDIPAPSTLAPGLPRDLDALVLRALRPRIDERYDGSEAMRAALAGWLGKAAPTTDAARLGRFLSDLFGETINEQREGTLRLLHNLRESHAPPPPPPPSAATPARLKTGALVDDRYLLRRVIGEGGMGEVWEAEHRQIGRTVAIKFLRHLHARGPQAMEAFRQEARAASRIGHPNVVDVTDAGTHGDTLYLVMELLQGRTLLEELKEGPRPLLRALYIAQQVADTLAAAHREGVVHRDLKPANIFLTTPAISVSESSPSEPTLKVLDFGIALNLSEEESQRVLDQQIAGTLYYMAPEQILGAQTDHRADVYSLGVVLFEMLSGALPYRGQTPEETRQRKLHEDAPTLPGHGIPPALLALLASMLHRDPAQRPATMREVVDALAQVRAELVSPVPRPLSEVITGRTEVPQQPPRVLWLASAVGVLVGLLGVFGAALVVLPRVIGPAPDLAPPDRRPHLDAGPRVTPLDLGAPVADLAQPERSPPDLGGRPDPVTGRGESIGPPLSLAEAQHLLLNGRSFLDRGQRQAAEAACKDAQRHPRVRCQALVCLAEIAIDGNDFRKAEQMGERAVRCRGAGTAAHLIYGHALVRTGKAQKAREQFQRVLRIDPENAAALKGIERTP